LRDVTQQAKVWSVGQVGAMLRAAVTYAQSSAPCAAGWSQKGAGVHKEIGGQ